MEEIAVLIPCLNEALTIGKVVSDFRRELPEAKIFVYDNGSTDGTLEIARDHGASVALVEEKGKTNVVRKMLCDIHADIYVLVDGDDTYDAAMSPLLIRQLESDKLDMVIGARNNSDISVSSRFGHGLGNRIFTMVVNLLFRTRYEDALSGYRVMTRQFVKCAYLPFSGFELEVALSAHAARIGARTLELKTHYKERPAGSSSKLKTFGDGLKILYALLILLVMHEKNYHGEQDLKSERGRVIHH